MCNIFEKDQYDSRVLGLDISGKDGSVNATVKDTGVKDTGYQNHVQF